MFLERDDSQSAALRSALPDVPVTVGDATTRAANDVATAATIETFGGLDVLVDCVGVFDLYRVVGHLDADLIDDAFDEMFTTNVRSQLHSVRAALPAMPGTRDGAGVVLLTESTSASYAGRGGVRQILVVDLAATAAQLLAVHHATLIGTHDVR